MKKLAFTLMVMLFFEVIHSQTPFSCKGQYFLSLTPSNANYSGLYEVKIAENGQNIFLDTISPNIGLVLNGMGYRITDNLIYGVDPRTARMRKIGSDGVAIDLGIPQGIPIGPYYYAGEVTPDGKYLLLIGLSQFSAQIVKVDLNDPNYKCSFVAMKNQNVGIVDIAFDPFTGILYGQDLNNKKIVIIDPNTGDVNSNFARQNQVDQLGALFFDSFGNLYGYGAYGTNDQNKFVGINKVTGVMTLLASGPLSVGQDGCACPYTMELQKIVTPDTTFPCTDVVYSFIISNGSGATREHISLVDTMPLGLNAKSIIRNPYGGQMVLKDNILRAEELIIPPGIDTIQAILEVGPVPIGLYKNQAVLSGLPPALGSFSLSDNPLTLREKDSTYLWVIPLDITYIDENYRTCPNDSVLVDVYKYGLSFEWSDGDTNAQKWLKSPSSLTVKASTLCDQKQVDIVVEDDLITLNIIEDTFYIVLGEQIHLVAQYYNSSNQVVFEWESTNNPTVDCQDCAITDTYPLNDGKYTLVMTNEEGCVAKDVVYVRVKKDRSIFAPNIISVNDDNVNDIFYLSSPGLGVVGEYLKIYDRWGNKVFDSGIFELNQPSDGWNGKFKGQKVEQGVYTWVAFFHYLDGFEQISKGDVTVIR